MKIKADPVSHLAYLIEWVGKTKGDVLELGIGIASTPVLHELCRSRRLVSYENNKVIYDKFRRFKSDWHEIIYVENWQDAPIERSWGLAFVDCDPARERAQLIRRLREYADYILVHDTDAETDHKFRMAELIMSFNHFHHYMDYRPQTTILSDKHDI